MEGDRDQVVRITTHDGQTHEAVGGPEIIAERLRTGQQVLCGMGEDEYIIRILGPQTYIRYPEGVS